MAEFMIEFKDVPVKEQDDIRAELRALKPEADCIEDNSFVVALNRNGRYELTCKKRGSAGNQRLLAGQVDETEPAGIAGLLRKLTKCW
jgi:hypothetical protein